MEKIKAIEFEYGNIDVVSKKQYDVHLELYKGYVKKINEIWQKLEGDAQRSEANAAYSYYRGLKKGETYSLDGVILHELYFSNIGGSNNEPHGYALELIKKAFGSFDKWVQDIKACGMAARGWAILAYDQRSRTLQNFLLDAHDEGSIWNAYPLLVLDVYEHAYYIDYANKKSDYIENFITDIDWNYVNRRANALK